MKKTMNISFYWTFIGKTTI